MAKRRYVILGLLLVLTLAGGLMCFWKQMVQKNKSFAYRDTGDMLFNPLTGFAPNADDQEAVGENTLVYVDVTWRELEPKEGVYDFDGICEKNNLKKWREEGKNVVFRFVCDRPSGEEHMDIPDWLYEKTGDGTFYDMEYGKGYSPDYANETFISCHARAIEALGETFGEDAFFSYIELGSVGHWGEWHVNYEAGITRLPGEAVLREYVLPYLTAFPKACFLMRRPFTFVSDYGLGVYNDMTGMEEDTKIWLTWIGEGGRYNGASELLMLPACPKIWEKAPVGGEFTSSLPMAEMLDGELKRTLSLLADSHMTFLGPKCPTGEELLYPEQTAAVRSKLGYRYGISKADFSYRAASGELALTLTVKNYGVAPLYFDWPVCVYLFDEAGEVKTVTKTGLKLCDILQDEEETADLVLEIDEDTFFEGKLPLVAVGIENPETGKPSVYLAMNTESRDFRYYLNRK